MTFSYTDVFARPPVVVDPIVKEPRPTKHRLTPEQLDALVGYLSGEGEASG